MRPYLLLLLVGIALTSCSASNKTFNNSTNWLPPDFDAKKDILVIEKLSWPPRQQRLIEEYMKEKYNYQYVFIEPYTSVNIQYPDSSKYRFVILNTSSSHTMSPGSTGRSVTVGMFDFYFYDRMTKKKYPATNRGSSWASMTFKPIINTILAK